MNIDVSENSIINVLKEEVKNLSLDNSLDEMKKEAGNIIINTVDKAANYVIRAMPIPDALKDILTDIKKAIKSKDFKEIIKTVINSSIREGLEALGVSKSSITSIINLKDVMVKGGLIQGIKNCVEILANKYLKNNIVGEHVYNFFNKLKESVLNKTFKESINIGMEKSKKKAEDFIANCKNWYNSYDNLDFESMNEIANSLKKSLTSVKWNVDCIKENKVIQNMTKLVNNKKEKLSNNQLQLCRSM